MPYLKRMNSLPLINHISYKYAQVSDIGPSWSSCFAAFIEDNATMSSIQYFENYVFCAKPKGVDTIKLISLRQISVTIALKYIINNSVLK